jgi:uncharacterized protein
MVISEHNYARLLTHAKWKQFSSKPIPDAHKTTGVLIALALDSKQAVDDLAAKAVKAGGREPSPKRDYGCMVQRTFEDLDGHTWEPFFMDPAHVRKSSSWSPERDELSVLDFCSAYSWFCYH